MSRTYTYVVVHRLNDRDGSHLSVASIRAASKDEAIKKLLSWEPKTEIEIVPVAIAMGHHAEHAGGGYRLHKIDVFPPTETRYETSYVQWDGD